VIQLLKAWVVASILWISVAGSVSVAADVVACENASGATYYAESCGDDVVIEEVTLSKTSRLDPAPENPVQGLKDYYSRLFALAKFNLQELGIVD